MPDSAVSAPPPAPLVEQAPGDRAPRPVHASRRRVAFALAAVTAIVLALVGVYLYWRSAAERVNSRYPGRLSDRGARRHPAGRPGEDRAR
jgi:hypothetical protein